MIWRSPSIAFVNGRVVLPDGGFADTLIVRGTQIERIGEAPRRHDAIVDLDGAFIFPGLINAHDHLELNSFGRLRWRPRHDNVREWIADFQPRFATDPDLAEARPETLADRLWVGGLKNLLSGVTTVCHHNPLHALLRRPFPVRVIKNYRYSHSLQIDGDAVAEVCRATPDEWPWIIHAAEGVDAEAAREIDRLDAMGCLGERTVLVHGVGIAPGQAARVIATGTSLVWCPSSNDFLFGRTAAVEQFADAGRLALGTDSRLSGAGDLFDEMRAAHTTGQLSPSAIARTVTVDAARVLRIRSAGRIEPGAPADLTVLRPRAESAAESLIASTRADVRLTMIDGQPLVGDATMSAVFDACSTAAMAARVDDRARHVARWIGTRVLALRMREPGLEVAA